MNEWSFESLPPKAARVRIQGSFGIPELNSVPQPDVAWLRRRDYSTTRPTPNDVLLVIEVADSSLAKDRGLKAKLYAKAGISDYWIVNIPGQCIEVGRDPQGKVYRSVEVFRAGQEVRPLAFPDVVLPVDRIFTS